jgi:hypothetical protein
MLDGAQVEIVRDRLIMPDRELFMIREGGLQFLYGSHIGQPGQYRYLILQVLFGIDR